MLGADAVPNTGYLTSNEIALFHSQGYLLKSGCFDREAVERFGRQVDSMVERAQAGIVSAECQDRKDEEQMLFIDGSRVVFKRRPDGSTAIARINGVTGMEPGLMEAVRGDRLVRTFFELLGTSDIEQLISQMHPKLPGDGISFPRHQDIQFRRSFDPDWEDVLGNGSYAICTIAIDPMTKENGGLWVDRSNYPVLRGDPEDRVWIDAAPGDVLFMHPYLFHGSGPNLSNQSRRTLLAGYCAYGANHRAYPGAHVNARLQLQEDGSITAQPAPWSQTPVTAEGHH